MKSIFVIVLSCSLLSACSNETGTWRSSTSTAYFGNYIVVINKDTTGDFYTLTNDNAGNSQPHDNIQPVLACYYIMYIP